MNTQPLSARQQELIEGLNSISDEQERLAALTSYVTRVSLPVDQCTEDLRVHGCVSRVWVQARCDQGQMRFLCAADSPMVAALVATLCALYDQSTPAEVLAVEPDFWEKCGFQRRLTPTRLNGLAAVREKLRHFANAASQSSADHGE